VLKAYIIEDLTIMRDMLCHILDKTTGIEVVGSSADGREGLDECLKEKPDFLLVDVDLPSLNGLEIVRMLKASKERARILVFSAFPKRHIVKELIKLGVDGFVEKSAHLEELEKAIAAVAGGQTYYSSFILDVIKEMMSDPEHQDSIEYLSPREREIIQLIAESHSTKEIAATLGISVRTADTHRSNIMNKLDIHDVAGLTRFAIAEGIALKPESSP